MHLLPRRSGVHRAACLALFRALLRQAKHLPLSQVQQTTVETQIKEVVRRNLQFQSFQKTSTALRLGYVTLEALRRPPHGIELFKHIVNEGTRRCSEQRCGAILKVPAHVSQGRVVASSPSRKLRPRVWPWPGAAKVLDRPHANLSGRRHVPKLVNANRVPILRFKKPQSPFLGRIIRDNIRTRDARIHLIVKLRELLAHAHGEDDWDQILATEAGLSMDHSECAWSVESHDAIGRITILQSQAGNKRISMAVRMQAIVEEEKALVMDDKTRKEKQKYMAKKARYLASIENQKSAKEEQILVRESAAIEGVSLPEEINAKVKPKQTIGADSRTNPTFPVDGRRTNGTRRAKRRANYTKGGDFEK